MEYRHDLLQYLEGGSMMPRISEFCALRMAISLPKLWQIKPRKSDIHIPLDEREFTLGEIV